MTEPHLTRFLYFFAYLTRLFSFLFSADVRCSFLAPLLSLNVSLLPLNSFSVVEFLLLNC